MSKKNASSKFAKKRYVSVSDFLKKKDKITLGPNNSAIFLKTQNGFRFYLQDTNL